MAAQPPHAPAFRRLDIHVTEHEGHRGVVLTDPLGLIEDPVFVPDGLMPVVGRFDGVRTTAQIHEELTQAQGSAVPENFVADLVGQLDERLLLLSPRFEEALDAAASEFIATGVRPARHAGSAGYPREPQECRDALAEMIPRGTREQRPARGLIAPHIDLARGFAGYREAYGNLAARPPADLYVIFGTGHQGPVAPVTGLPIDWDTPLGRVRTDRTFVDAIHARIGPQASSDLFLHRLEHSIEFQVLCLAHVLGPDAFEVAGFLTGAFPNSEGDPGNEDYLRRIVAAFEHVVAESGKSVCFVGGADLAHLGPFFGDPDPVDEIRLAQLHRDEDARLAHLLDANAGAFHREVEGNGNPDRVCGTSPIYLTARLAGGNGRLLHYGQAPAADGSQVVSFCSMVFD